MVETLGLDGGTPNASPEVACKPQEEYLRKEVGGSQAMGGGPDLQSEKPHAKEPETRRRGG